MESDEVLGHFGRAVRTSRGRSLAERWFHALYETPLLFSGMVDTDGRVLDANRLSVEGCGFDRDLVIGQRFWECGWWTRPEDPELARHVRAWFAEAVGTGEPVRVTSHFYVACGDRRIVDLSLQPVGDDR